MSLTLIVGRPGAEDQVIAVDAERIIGRDPACDREDCVVPAPRSLI